MNDFSPETIFISYARSDGRPFAEEFERRLKAEGIESWRDLKSIEGGEDILSQVLRAIEQVKHLVLILSRRALGSDWVRREWTHARMVGRKVSPVLADPNIKRSDLPSWMRRADVYDIGEEDVRNERWEMLVHVLRASGETRRVPYMAGDLIENFVARPLEYAALKRAVLWAKGGSTVGITTALVGAGGYGKTTLANALCRDPEVRFEFTDGILRVEVGKERDSVTGLVVDLIEKLDPHGKRPGFQDVQTAADHLGELIGEARLLLVVDDVWREAQLRPFLRGGPNCVRLVTTRMPRLLPGSHVPVVVDEMGAAEALDLIATGLPQAEMPLVRPKLAALAVRLDGWAQMLAIANGWLRARISRGERLADAITGFEQRLVAHGLTGFDQKDRRQQSRAIRLCVDASLADLDGEELARFCELAVLPEDEAVPLRVVAGLWSETGDLIETQMEDLVQRLADQSLLQNLNLSARTLRLHDNMVSYLRDRISAEQYKSAHRAMVQALAKPCDGDWAKLPPQEVYAWRFLIYHLRRAEWEDKADQLLTDYAWIKAKLHATNVQELLADYLTTFENGNARLVGRAIALSVPVLSGRREELARQMYGRLGLRPEVVLARLVETARADVEFRPAPRWPGLTPPGEELLRVFGHSGGVNNATFSAEGGRIVTASNDHTARVWDSTTGAEIATLRGHESWVMSASLCADGTRIVTASNDGTTRVWDAATGVEIAALPGRWGERLSAAFSADGTSIVTTSSHDNTARMWDAVTGTELVTLARVPDFDKLIAISADSACIISTFTESTRMEDAEWAAYNAAESDSLDIESPAFHFGRPRAVRRSTFRAARVWDLATGQEIAVLRGHEAGVWSAAFSTDGKRVVTASDDGTARVWDARTGAEIMTLRGHENYVNSAAFSPDGTRIVTASEDRTARVWDAGTGAAVAILRGHGDRVNSAVFSPDGRRIATSSEDGSARVWDAAAGTGIAVPPGHQDWVLSATFSSDGTRIVTASEDSTARVWDAGTGAEIAALRGHNGRVWKAAYSADCARIITASFDGTARVWDAATGAEIATLSGHKGRVWTASYSADGTRIVTASDDRTGRVWDAGTGKEIVALRGHKGRVWTAACSADSTRIVTASQDRTARVWDAGTGTGIVVLRGHKNDVWSAAFSPDGTRIVTASGDGSARVWDSIAGAQCLNLPARGGVFSAAFSADGTRIVTASFNGIAQVWDAATGDEIAALCERKGWLTNVAFSVDGARIISTYHDGTDGTICVWDAGTGAVSSHIALDGGVRALDVHGTAFAVGDTLGRVHVYDAPGFLCSAESPR